MTTTTCPPCDAGGDDAFDQVARSVGEELRRRAPDDGVERLALRRKAQVRTRTALVGGAAALLVVAGLAMGANRGDDKPSTTVVDTQTSTATSTPASTAGPTVPTTDALVVADSGRHPAAAPGADPTPDRARDEAIAEKGLLRAELLGTGWTVVDLPKTAGPISRDELTSKPACAAFADDPSALTDVADRQTQFTGPANQSVYDDVTIYPTVAEASAVMDLLANPDWVRCTIALNDATLAQSQPGATPHSTGIKIAPPVPHGDRQISYGIDGTFADGTNHISRVVLVVVVQVGRALVVVTPPIDINESTDPNGSVERTVASAVGALQSALIP